MRPASFCAASCAIKLPEFKDATAVAKQLLDTLGAPTESLGIADHPALAWRRSGLFPLSGDPDGERLIPPIPLAASVDGAMLALKAAADKATELPLNGALLLGERSRLLGVQRNGQYSTGGDCRLLETLDGRIALNLARDEDWGLIEAWLGTAATSWEAIADIVSGNHVDALVKQATILGLPIARDAVRPIEPWFEEYVIGTPEYQDKTPLVVDLSSLWAGPLAGNLLQLSGAEVIKVESSTRPDGARRGNTDFYNLLNAGKKSVALDFATSEGRDDLKKLVSAADIVIEASRPRALRQLDIDAEQLVLEKPGKVWIRLMAYGRDENRIGFGDDIGISAGLSTIMEQVWGRPYFVGDAIADPISGIYGALTAWTKWKQGGGSLINLSMVDIVRDAAQIGSEKIEYVTLAQDWQKLATTDRIEQYPMRLVTGKAEQMGKSNNSVMASIC